MTETARQILEALGWTECTPEFERCLYEGRHGAHWMDPDGGDDFLGRPDLDSLETLDKLRCDWAKATKLKFESPVYNKSSPHWSDSGPGYYDGMRYWTVLEPWYGDEEDWPRGEGVTRVQAWQNAFLAALEYQSEAKATPNPTTEGQTDE